ncbi:MAG: ATP-binding cassette domain-containing protein [Anaerolineae bacterium]
MNLLPRFWDVTSGAVTIDGYDVRAVTQRSLRSQIGMVLQDTFLFAESVLENIRYGRPDATDDEVKAAAALAHADGFIAGLADGWDTVLGERGAGLSQGQRQLLAIARAALSDPRILILDEATSSVDTRTERLIQAALAKLLAGRTSFVIAHRLSTICDADQVLMLEAGRIVERGTHTSLLAAGGAYAKLYASQFEGGGLRPRRRAAAHAARGPGDKRRERCRAGRRLRRRGRPDDAVGSGRRVAGRPVRGRTRPRLASLLGACGHASAGAIADTRDDALAAALADALDRRAARPHRPLARQGRRADALAARAGAAGRGDRAAERRRDRRRHRSGDGARNRGFAADVVSNRTSPRQGRPAWARPSFRLSRFLLNADPIGAAP